MGKRTSYARNPRDYYPTPYEAVLPLLPHIFPDCNFIEPCAGDGRLIDHLQKHGHRCVGAYDIEPQRHDIEKADALFFGGIRYPECDLIITNPPWEREVLHKVIRAFTAHAPTWLLFDADWMHTVQAAPFQDICRKIVSVGRVSWMGNGSAGMENACWYLFATDWEVPTQFVFKTT